LCIDSIAIHNQASQRQSATWFHELEKQIPSMVKMVGIEFLDPFPNGYTVPPL